VLLTAELIEKLYAYRGDEPGVAHGDEEVPNVDQHDAQFVLNAAAAIGSDGDFAAEDERRYERLGFQAARGRVLGSGREGQTAHLATSSVTPTVTSSSTAL